MEEFDALFDRVLKYGKEELKKKAKALAWARQAINCIGTKKLEGWFIANYMYFLHRERPFTTIDQAHVYVKDDQIVISLISNLKGGRTEGNYFPLEHLLILQDIMDVYIELNVKDKKIKKKAINTLKTIEKFPAVQGKTKAKWRWNEEVEPPSLLKKSVKEILEEIQKKARRMGCFQTLKKAIG